MRLAIVLANFTPGEAEQLRRAMAAWKRNEGVIAAFKERIVAGMIGNGYSAEFAESCMNQIKGFSEYGFPESHAASFALLVYASAWIKCHYPAHFAAALLNSQPMGFYAPSQIVSDAKAHGVEARPIDLLRSKWDCTLEYDGAPSSRPSSRPALRLGLRLVKSLGEAQANLIVRAVERHGPFASVKDLWSKARPADAAGPEARLRKASLQACARADAFRSMGLSSREALWEIRSLHDEPLPLEPFGAVPGPPPPLPKLSKQQEMFQDYSATGLSLKAHPISFLRAELERRGVSTAAQLRTVKLRGNRHHVSVAGIAIVRQRPGTAKGMVFITLEDETGISNLMVRPQVFERYQKQIIGSGCLLATGVLDRVGEVVYVTAGAIESLDDRVLASKAPLPSKSYSY